MIGPPVFTHLLTYRLQNRPSKLDPIIEAITPPTDEKICKLKYFEHLCRQEFREAYCLKAAFRRKILGRIFSADSRNISWLRDLWISITPEVLIDAAQGNFFLRCQIFYLTLLLFLTDLLPISRQARS